MKEVIVREYLESLKEDTELDLIFPLLLDVLGFLIVTTPIEYKGHKQYGKDIVAFGIDPTDNIKKRFYFELKGGSDKDIKAANYEKNDGIRMSIIEAKDKEFVDNTIPNFNDSPVKIVIVHNGVLKPDIRDTFNGLIKREFPKNDMLQFARWDISKLTQLFSQHLFGEYLLTNTENIRLFKRMLVFMDVPEYSQRDFYILVNNLISNTDIGSLSKKYFPVHLTRFFATLKLLLLITHQYSKEVNNLETSKKCTTYLILRTWEWILKHSITDIRKIQLKFNELREIHKTILREYFDKLIPIAQLKNGLFSEVGGRFEQVGYPIRCFEFLKYLNYWFSIDKSKTIEEKKTIINTIIRNNDGFIRPLVDIHSIPIALTLSFYIENGFLNQAKGYLLNIFNQIIVDKTHSNKFPDGMNNLESVVRLYVKNEKSIYYVDSSSSLIGILFEFLAILNLKEEYDMFIKFFINLHLTTFIPFSDEFLKSNLNLKDVTHETLLFNRGIYNEGFESQIVLDEVYDEFKSKTNNKDEYEIEYETEKLGMGELLILAHIYYDTPIFPKFWRRLLE